MLKDRQGNEVSGASAEALAHYDQAVEAFNIYTGDPIALLDKAIAAAPDLAMAHILKAHLFAVATEPEATEGAKAIVESVKSMKLSEREASHVAALDLLLKNEWTRAALFLDRHNVRWPLDLVALQIGHLADFYRASARSLRDRIARVLPRWSSDTPGFSFVLGFHSFGLEETGDYFHAEEAGRRAIELNPRDCWAHHAVTHVMEMQGRPEHGIGWMTAREPHWADAANFFKVHNWWHRALFHIELGEGARALALYDGPIRKDKSAVALDLVDASALLWRLSLSGHDVGTRWQELSQVWDRHADGKLYPFNDWHAVMAYLGAGREDEVARILAAFQSGNGAETSRWARETGLPLVEGFTAFWRGDYGGAVERLHGARLIANSFGGSHAQRDIIDWTLTEAAIRGGFRDLAEALAHERLSLKPHSPINRAFLSRARGD